MTAPDVIVIEAATTQIEVPAELRSLLDRAGDVGEVLVMVARRHARLQVQIDAHVFALAKAHGENGDGVVLGQVQSDLEDNVNATVSLVAGILGVMGAADPEAGNE